MGWEKPDPGVHLAQGTFSHIALASLHAGVFG